MDDYAGFISVSRIWKEVLGTALSWNRRPCTYCYRRTVRGIVMQHTMHRTPCYSVGMELRAFTVRLPTDLAADLEAVAAAEGTSIAEEIRQAIGDRITAKRADAKFRARVRSIIDQNQRVLERLAE